MPAHLPSELPVTWSLPINEVDVHDKPCVGSLGCTLTDSLASGSRSTKTSWEPANHEQIRTFLGEGELLQRVRVPKKKHRGNGKGCDLCRRAVYTSVFQTS